MQGVDYAYTLQGWLKGINSDKLDADSDMGNDGKSTTMFERVSHDVYGFKLGYFNDDYKPIGGANAPAFSQHAYTAPAMLAASGNQLFNGNISYSTLALSKMNSGATTGYTYGYDQLNRLVQMRQHSINGAWDNSNIINAYSESISYDANGNILKYLRKGAGTAGNPLDMDSLNYQYHRDANGNLTNNRLNHVRDAVGDNNYTVDIDNQSDSNYHYDAIGNLKTDIAEGINNIDWTVYGKIKNIYKTTGIDLSYRYDGSGNRIVKEVAGDTSTTTTFYVRDAQGNTMAVYTKKGSEPLRWNEQHLYGSSRLGIWQWDSIVPAQAPVVQGSTPLYDSAMYGRRQYELPDHLGNVRATLSDKKIGVSLETGSSLIDHYIADVLSQQDYYPGGMLMPGRTINSSSYRFSINGQEKEKEINENITSAEFWMYDSRIVRRWNVDPRPNVAISPYNAFAGNPIWFSDALGDSIITGNYSIHSQLDKAYESLLKVPSGYKLLKQYATSSKKHVYLNMVDLKGETAMFTIPSIPTKFVNKDGSLNTAKVFSKQDYSEKAYKVINDFALTYRFKQDGELMHFIGINMHDDKNLKYDKYDLMFMLYHEVYAHVKNQKSSPVEEHVNFGNYSYAPGMRLKDPDIAGGTTVVYGTEAWNVFKEILSLKIKNKDADQQNKDDYKYMVEQEKIHAQQQKDNNKKRKNG